MFNSTSYTHRYISHDMMMEKSDWSGGDNGKGDALWRTSIAYITYGEPMLKTSLLKCFRKFKMINKKKYWYQGSRAWDRHREDDVSRDQIIMALTALKFNGDLTELKELTDHLPKRLSRRFRGSFVLRFWMKAISRDSQWYTFWFHFFELVEFIPSVLMNKILRLLAGRTKSYDPDWFSGFDNTIPFWYHSWNVPNSPQWVWVDNPEDYPEINNGHKLANEYARRQEKNKFLKFTNLIMYPGYALHLNSWMTHVSGNSILKKLLQSFICWEAEDNNYLIRLLMGKSVTHQQIFEYTPIKNYRWSTRMDKSNSCYALKGDDARFNIIDKDILLKLKNYI